MKQQLLRYLQVPHLVLSMLIFGCIAALLVALWVGLWAPMQAKHLHVSADAQAQRQSLMMTRNRIDMIDQAATVRAALAVLDEKRAKTATQADLIAEVGTLVRRSNVAILHSDNLLDQQADGISWFRQDITVEGTYPAIRYFLQLAGSTDHLTLIEQVDWSASKNTAAQKARIRLATLFGAQGGDQ